MRDLEVAVSVRGGRTRITVRENLGPLIGAVYGGIGGGMGGGGFGPIMGIFAGAFHVSGATLGLIIPVWLAVTFATARTVFRRSTGRRAKEVANLAERLAALARELVPRPAALASPQRPPTAEGRRVPEVPKG